MARYIPATTAEPYTLTADDVLLARCREDDNDSNTPYIDAVMITGWRIDTSQEKYKNIVMPETLPFDRPVLDENGVEKRNDEGNVITETADMPVIKAYMYSENAKQNLEKITFSKNLRVLAGGFEKYEKLSEAVIPEDSSLEECCAAAFAQTAVRSLYIPKGFKEIPDNMFYGCKNLTAVTFAQDIQLERIGQYAFCESTLTNIDIPDTVTEIGIHAFEQCALTEVKLPDSMESIPDYMFYYNTGLKKVTFGSLLTTIGEEAFVHTAIEELVIPDTVTYIKKGAFNDIEALRSVTIGSGLKELGGCADLGDFNTSSIFQNDVNIETVTFSEGLERIGYDEPWGGGSFRGCDLHEIILPDSVTEVGNYCFSGNIHAGKIKFSANMTVIPDYFLDCYAQDVAAYSIDHGSDSYTGVHGMLKQLIIPDNIKEIGYDAFDGCLDLEYLDLGKVEYIGTGAFSISGMLLGALEMEHGSLTTVVMSPELKEIGTRPPHSDDNADYDGYAGVFDGQGDFEGLSFPDTLEKVGKYALYNCSAVREFNVTQNLKSIDDHAFDGCINLEKLTFADQSEVKIGEEVFKYCKGLTEVTLPSWLEVVPVGMFSGCKKLARVTIPEGVKEIRNNAFSDTALTSVILPESCLYINDGVFQNAPVTYVKFGSNTLSIGANAFVRDTNINLMQWVYIPETVKFIGERAFGYYKDSELGYEELCELAEELGCDVQALIMPTIANHDFILYGGRAAQRYAEENGMIYGGAETPDVPDIPDIPETPDEPQVYGDIDGDGKISAKDSLNIQRYVINLKQLDEAALKAADVNDDGKVTAKDALEILR